MNNVVSLKRYCTAKDIVKKFSVARSTVDSWVNQGLLTKFKIGNKCVRFDLDEVERLAEVI